MKDFIIIYLESGCEKYVTGKTFTREGVKFEKFTSEKIRAKFYNSEKIAKNKAKKLNLSGLYRGVFIVKELKVTVHCK